MWQIIDIYLGVLIMAIAFFLFARIVLKKKAVLNIWNLILSITV